MCPVRLVCVSPPGSFCSFLPGVELVHALMVLSWCLPGAAALRPGLQWSARPSIRAVAAAPTFFDAFAADPASGRCCGLCSWGLAVVTPLGSMSYMQGARVAAAGCCRKLSCVFSYIVYWLPVSLTPRRPIFRYDTWDVAFLSIL